MTLYTDMDCGIELPHRHTGEIVHGHHIEYWCPTLTAWVRDLSSYGNKCSCMTLHMRARIQDIQTEIIEILDPAEYDVREWLKKELEEQFQYWLMEGEDAYNRKYGDGNVQHDSSSDGDVRDRDENPAPRLPQGEARGYWVDPTGG